MLSVHVKQDTPVLMSMKLYALSAFSHVNSNVFITTPALSVFNINFKKLPNEGFTKRFGRNRMF